MPTAHMTADELMDVALRSERFIHSQAKDTDAGRIWALAPEASTKYFHNLYSGAAGVALFYLELYQATQNAQHLATAEQAGLEVVAKINTIDELPCAPAGGWGGYLFALKEIAQLTGNRILAEAAHRCAEKQRSQATVIGGGIGWVQEMPYAKLTGFKGEREIYDVAEGAAGASLALLYAYETGVHPNALEWAQAAADRLLEVAETAEGGLRWQLMNDIPWPFNTPNFAHGTAGVAYFMARVFEHTQDQKYLDAALAGAGHVQAMARNIDGGGHLVPHNLDDGHKDRFYLGYCHGPAGTARLFYLLGELTRDAQWLQWGRGLDEGLLSLGAPEERGRGFWNNISQCCCDAGIGDHAVSMYRATQDELYLDLAQRVANELVQRSQGDQQSCYWPQAEHRSQPEFIQTQTGYMQGAAGVGSFFVHLATTLQGKPVKIHFPESPFRRL